VTTKISVSLSDDDLAALDAHVRSAGLPGRSAGVQEAIRRMRLADLGADYASAFGESDDAESRDWDTTTADGLT
jgi:hypothetical protein